MKQIRDLVAELEEERKQKTNAVNGKKKLEADYKDLEGQVEMSAKLKEDALKQLRKIQVTFHTAAKIPKTFNFKILSFFKNKIVKIKKKYPNHFKFLITNYKSRLIS